MRLASSALNSISRRAELAPAYAPTATAACERLLAVMRSLCTRWMSLVAMKVWRCGCSAGRIASQARCGSPSGSAPGRPRRRPAVSAAMRWTASKSPGEAAGKPASMTSTLQAGQLARDLQLLAEVSEAPGACSPSRRVVSKMCTGTSVLGSPLPGVVAGHAALVVVVGRAAPWRRLRCPALPRPGSARSSSSAAGRRPARSGGRGRLAQPRGTRRHRLVLLDPLLARRCRSGRPPGSSSWSP